MAGSSVALEQLINHLCELDEATLSEISDFVEFISQQREKKGYGFSMPFADERSHLSRWNRPVKIYRRSQARYLTWSPSYGRSAEHTDQCVRAPRPQNGKSRG
jgi:hypothetical protein